jgi:hypothetical protein
MDPRHLTPFWLRRRGPRRTRSDGGKHVPSRRDAAPMGPDRSVELRLLLAVKPAALSAVGCIFIQEIQRWQRQRAQALGFAQAKGAVVSLCQRFGSSLNLNIHWHAAERHPERHLGRGKLQVLLQVGAHQALQQRVRHQEPQRGARHAQHRRRLRPAPSRTGARARTRSPAAPRTRACARGRWPLGAGRCHRARDAARRYRCPQCAPAHVLGVRHVGAPCHAPPADATAGRWGRGGIDSNWTMTHPSWP